MIGPKAAVGLSLLCALVFSAFAAQSAAAQGTTTFTCVKEGITEFRDAHCDVPDHPGGPGGYTHAFIPANTKTLIDVTNAKTSHETAVTTPALLRGTLGGVTFEVECTEVTGKATIENKEIEKVMQNEGTGIKTEFTKCTVTRPENAAEERHPCKVKEPIVQEGSSISRENLGAGGKEMGTEFKPPAEKPFVKFIFEGANCSLKEKTVEVTGTAIATPNTGSNLATTNEGGTLKFTTAMTAEGLKVGAAAAEFKTVLTPMMYDEATKTTENPIVGTTTLP